MKHPKKADQAELMGLKCSFNAEYYRDYGKEKSEYGHEFGHVRKTPVKWKKQKHKQKTGWIVGFGFCFDGTLKSEVSLGEDYKYFVSSKRVDYVRVRLTTTGPEIKVPAINIIHW